MILLGMCCALGLAASYPVTIDPVAPQAYLKASNTGASDFFGHLVMLSGDTLVVGAHQEASNASGVNGAQGDNSAQDSGAVYVFVRSGTGWSQQAYLKASNSEAADLFGYSLALSGDTLVVGAPLENSAASGVDGDENDNSAQDSGAAYVFVRSGTSWIQQAYLKASNSDAIDKFGYSVALWGDTLVVGSLGEDSNASGVNGDQSDNGAIDSGAAYVFVRSGSSWSQEAYLKASNTDALDRFGAPLSLSGDTLVVGVRDEDSAASGVNGDQIDNSAIDSGAAYVFVRSGNSWSQQAYLKASNTDAEDSFGRSVSVSGDTLAVGANSEGSNASGVNGEQSDNSALGAGAAYVFVRNGTDWSQQAYLKASNTGSKDDFGLAVWVTGDTLAVGANGEDSNASGVNGEQGNNSASNSGAAYVFVRSGNSWSQQTYLKASNTGAGDLFGISASLSGGMLVVGASREGSGAVGVNGDQGDNSAPEAGAVYVFDLSATWTDLGGGTPGSAGPPTLVGEGSLLGGTPASVTLTNAPSGAALVGWISFAPTPFAALGGTVHAFPFASQFFFTAHPSGSFAGATTWPTGIAPGTQVWFQFLVQDLATIHGITLSNGLLATAP